MLTQKFNWHFHVLLFEPTWQNYDLRLYIYDIYIIMCNYDISMTHNQTYNLTTHNSLAVPAMELGIDVTPLYFALCLEPAKA